MFFYLLQSTQGLYLNPYYARFAKRCALCVFQKETKIFAFLAVKFILNPNSYSNLQFLAQFDG
jgi:hypothetical protein